VVTEPASGPPEASSRPRTVFELGDSDRPLRLDQFVARVLGIGRKRAREMCDRGEVRVDGRVCGKAAVLGKATIVELVEPEAESPLGEPELALDVRLEHPELVVVCKPAGMPTVPLRAGERGTLVGALLARYPEMRGFGYRAREPGVVHRLDTLTSGLVVAARNASAFDALVLALKRGELKKRYLAVVRDMALPDSGSIERALAPDPRDASRVRVAGPDSTYAREARTSFQVLERSAGRALLEVDAGPAFRHQVRAHLAALGHPIVGDVTYGGELDARIAGRHALHASYVAWAGDAARSFEVSTGTPAEFRALLEGGRVSSES
jgi:23S rRNA pseudouridine1911/1915/1917 synthase